MNIKLWHIVQMDTHPDIGERIELIEEVTAEDFKLIAQNIPRKHWQWLERQQDTLGGVFSVPMRYEIKGGKLVSRQTDKRMVWRIERARDSEGAPCLTLRRMPDIDVQAPILDEGR